MYVPSAFAEHDRERLHEFMRRHSFAVLCSQGVEGLMASHLPLLLETSADGLGQLHGHMARANSQWRKAEDEVMVIFSGPHTYISPRWYEEEGQVPTWNYVAVHAYGTFQLVDDRDTLLRILRETVRFFEPPAPDGWMFDDSAEYINRLLGAIVGFRIEITRLEGKWKLGQNHAEPRRARAARALRAQGDEDSRAIADLMGF